MSFIYNEIIMCDSGTFCVFNQITVATELLISLFLMQWLPGAGLSHSASLCALSGISSCFVFVNTALQFSSALLWTVAFVGMLLSNLCVSHSCRLADCHPGAAGCRCRGNSGGLLGSPYFPLPGDAETALPHSGRVPLHCRYVFLLLSLTFLPKVLK